MSSPRRVEDELEEVLASTLAALAASDSPTNVHRAARYEILGAVERLKGWASSRDHRTLVDCEARLRRLRTDAAPGHELTVRRLASLVDRLLELPAPAPAREATAVPTSPDVMPSGTHQLESSDHLVAALSGLSRGLKRWPSQSDARTLRWPVDDEAAVQRLLWLALAPSFKQMRDEETVGSTGPPRWRPDFVFPILRVALEAKFLRVPSHWQTVYAAIAQDDAQCRSDGSPFESMMVVVWDHSCSTQLHDGWHDALIRLQSVRHAVLVARPSA